MISLIKEKSYDKRIDEFMQSECVICFEEFQKGAPVRQIPLCHHLFHTKCIDGWFRAKLTDAAHRCPLCNCEITLDKIKIAIKRKREDKRGKNFAIGNGKVQVMPAYSAN